MVKINTKQKKLDNGKIKKEQNDVMFGRVSKDEKFFYLSNEGKKTLITNMDYLIKVIEGDAEFVIFNELEKDEE